MMGQFEFLIDRCNDLATTKPWCHCEFQPGQSMDEMNRLEANAGFVVPDELRAFYQFSFGARLCMYKILTIDEMVAFRAELSAVYGNYRRSSILPFAYLVDVGDYVAFDLTLQSDGKIMIVDGFHELSPDEWKPICYGFENWLAQLADNGFEPFWLGDNKA